VGRLPGLAETPGPARSYPLNTLGRNFFATCNRRALRRQIAAKSEPHVAARPDRTYRDGRVNRRVRCCWRRARSDEELTLVSPARFTVTWLHHGGAIGRVGRKLEQAVQKFLFPEGSGRVWIGCEAGVMRDIRRHLLNERGMDRAYVHTQGYWKYGAMNHPDNDRGQDVG
jgi:hypothetical protein